MGPICYCVVFLRVTLCKPVERPPSGAAAAVVAPKKPEIVSDYDVKYKKHNTLLSLSEYVWFVYGALLRQGSILNPLSGLRTNTLALRVPHNNFR
jgi:hypothetical protein